MSVRTSNRAPAGLGSEAWLGESEMATGVREFDWDQTPLGPIATWPQSLKSAVAICLHSRFQMAIYWGPELNCIYNDAERDALRDRHPGGLGMPARELLRDSWDVVGPQLQAVVDGSEATWAEDRPLTFDRRGQLEVAYLTYSYSPILDDDGTVGGVLLVTEDTTARVLAERRIDAIRELAEATIDASTTRRACELATRTLAHGPDVPFALIYLVDGTGKRSACVAADRGAGALGAIRLEVDLEAPSDQISTLFRRLATVRSGGRRCPASLFVNGRGGSGAAEQVFVAVIARGAADPLDGYLVAGLRDDVAFDQAYEHFLTMVAMGVGRSVAAARAREAERQRVKEIVAAGRSEARTRHDGELRVLLSDLRAAQRRVATAGDAERRRIERDLHDGAQQRLMAIRLELAMAREILDRDPQTAGVRLEALHHELDETLEELRELAHGLYPALLASDGLYAALQSAARHCAIPVTVEEADIGRAPRSIENAAYFCCLEALQNATKHAGPRASASIRVRMTGGLLEFRVSDNGQGFDPTTVRPGYGIVNVRDRVEALGGHVEVTSAPGRGTTVVGRLPLS